MQAGQLDRKITLQHYNQTTDSAGGTVAEYSDYAEVWANVKDLRGTQQLIAQQTVEAITTKFTIRYRTDLLHTDRVVFNGKNYEIVGSPVDVGRRKYIELMCKARL